MPSSSVLFINCKMPVVTATTACSASRPVANAFGWGESTIYNLGFGSPAVIQRSSTILCTSRPASSGKGRAPVVMITILSDHQYEPRLMTILKITATTKIEGSPYTCENTQPMVITTKKKTVIRSHVFRMLLSRCVQRVVIQNRLIIHQEVYKDAYTCQA